MGNVLLSNFDGSSFGANGFDSETEEGSSTVQYLSAAAKRGMRGMRVTCAGVGDAAYVTKDEIGITTALGDTTYLGFWLNAVVDKPVGTTRLCGVMGSNNTGWYLQENNAGKLQLTIWVDTGGVERTVVSADIRGAWHWIVMEMIRASSDGGDDGGGAVWGDGVRGTAREDIDNDVKAAGTLKAHIGIWQDARDTHTVDIDDLVVATSYPVPPSDPAGKKQFLLLLG